MIQVTNGVVTVTVTKGAFNSYYKHRGFRALDNDIVCENSGVVISHDYERTGNTGDSSQQRMDDSDEYDEPDVDGDEVDLSEIPLGEMSFYQLSNYADQLELNHDGIRSKKELRSLIRKHLNS